MDKLDVGAEIVRTQREVRLAGVSNEAWGERLKRLIAAQPGVVGTVDVSDVRQVGTAAGGSNGTLLFNASYATAEGAQARRLVLRFLPTSGLFHRYDVAAQFNVQRQLAGRGVPLAPQCWLDAQGEHLVRPGYVMEQVDGVSPPMAWRHAGILKEASFADRQAISLSYVDALARLHAVDWQEAGLQWMEARAAGAKPIERETNWYWDALVWSGATQHFDGLGRVREWLIANEPEIDRVVVCHGDANLGNYLFQGTHVSAIVDWEMSFLGSPECDLTFVRVGDRVLYPDAPWLEGMATYDQMDAEYERRTGRRLQNMPYYELFTAYRIAVIGALALKHVPPEARATLAPALIRGTQLHEAPARALGVPGF